MYESIIFLLVGNKPPLSFISHLCLSMKIPKDVIFMLELLFVVIHSFKKNPSCLLSFIERDSLVCFLSLE